MYPIMVNGIRTICPRGPPTHRGSVEAPEFDMKPLKMTEGHIGRNVVNITIKIKAKVRIF